MKEGWINKKLWEVARVQNGYAFDSKQFNERGNGTPLIRIRDIKRNQTQTYTTEKCSEEFHIENGDLLIGMDGDFNVCSWEGGHAYLNQRVCHVVPSDKILSRFLYYLLPFPLKIINDKTTFATVKHLSSKQVGNIVMPVPEIDEQKRIVERLDAAFAHIDDLKANAEKQLTEARALFQKCLTKAMEPKEGWEEKKLKDIAQVRIGPFGSLLHKKDYISGGIPLVNPIHMIGGKIVANNDFTISDGKAKELSNYLLKVNDIVFARRGEVGRCALVSKDEEGYLCGTGSLFVRFNNHVNFAFMLMLFQSERCREYLEENASGDTMLNINASIVENMPLIFPSLSEQQHIVARLDSLSENVRKYEEIQRKVISECDALKQALLRKVFE